MKKRKKKQAESFWWIAGADGIIYAQSQKDAALEKNLRTIKANQEWWIKHIPGGVFPKLDLK